MKRRLQIAIVSVLIGCAFCIAMPFYGRMTPEAKVTISSANVKIIANAVCQWTTDVGALPESLGDLYPEYLDYRQVFYRYSNFPHSVVYEELLPSFINLTSDYRLATLNGDFAMIYEMPGVWEDRKVSYVLIERLPSNDWVYNSTGRVTYAEFEKLLLSKISEN